jgi:hypothetical protein
LKYKESDIIGFVKGGNIAMVHSLIKHYKLGVGAMNLRGPADSFTLSKDQVVSTEDWNPLLHAIAANKL